MAVSECSHRRRIAATLGCQTEPVRIMNRLRQFDVGIAISLGMIALSMWLSIR
jgi:ABC-type sulfate transport system permease component